MFSLNINPEHSVINQLQHTVTEKSNTRRPIGMPSICVCVTVL